MNINYRYVLVIGIIFLLFIISCKKKKNEQIPEIYRPLIDSIYSSSYSVGPGLESFYKKSYKYFYQNNKPVKIELRIKRLPEPSQFRLVRNYIFQYNENNIVYIEYDSLNNIIEQHDYLLDERGYAKDYTHDKNDFIIQTYFEVQSNNIFCTNPNWTRYRDLKYTNIIAPINQFNIFHINNPVFYYADFIGRASNNLIESAQGEWYIYTLDDKQRIVTMKYRGNSGEKGDDFEFYYK